MIDKRTVFVLGAGASCPYGYPSGSLLRKNICLSDNFKTTELYANINREAKDRLSQDIKTFISAFNRSHNQSIDFFINNNPKFAPTGKYIIAFEMLKSEQNSHFGEHAEVKQEESRTPSPYLSVKDNILRRETFQGGDWYFYLFNQLLRELPKKGGLPDFSDHRIFFITFNYDRSLEHFIYDSLRNSFTEVSEDKIVQSLRKLKILHVYGQILPFKWQGQEQGVDYQPPVDGPLLQRASSNIRTIYEEKQNPDLIEAQNFLKQADEILFLGFGYAPENMEVLGLPKLIPPRCKVYGTAFNMIDEEVKRLYVRLHGGRTRDKNIYLAPTDTQIYALDCLMLLKKCLN